MVLVPMALSKLEESYGPPAQLDLPGIALIAGFSFALVWGLMRGPEIGWGDPVAVSALGAALLLVVGFIVRLRSAAMPLIPPHLFAGAGFAGGLITTFCLYGALYATLFFITQFEQVAQGFGPWEAGLRILPWTATLFVVAPIAGALVNRLGERFLGSAGLALNAIGLAWLSLIAAVELPFLAMAPALVIMGAGVSFAMPAVQSGVLRTLQKAELGKASGAFSISRFLGGAFGVATAASVIASIGGFANPEAFTAGFRAVMRLMVCMTALGALAALSMPGKITVMSQKPATTLA